MAGLLISIIRLGFVKARLSSIKSSSARSMFTEKAAIGCFGPQRFPNRISSLSRPGELSFGSHLPTKSPKNSNWTGTIPFKLLNDVDVSWAPSVSGARKARKSPFGFW